MKKFIKSLIVLSLFPTSYAWCLDISGVQLGSSLADAKASMLKENSSYIFTPVNLADGSPAGIIASSKELTAKFGGSPVDKFVALQNKSNSIWFLSRTQKFTVGSRMQTPTLTSSLKEKFGSPSSSSEIGGSTQLMWEYDRNGKQYIGNPSKGPCFGVRIVPAMRGAFSAPDNFVQTCGTQIIVSAISTQPDKLVSEFTVNIANIKVMYDELNTSAINSEQEKQNKINEEKSKNIKPRI